MSYRNGETALDFIYSQMDGAVLKIADTSEELRGSTAGGFEGCPEQGKRFHGAVAQSLAAQGDGIALLLMYQQKHVKSSMEAERDYKRRKTDVCQQPTIEYSGLFGKIKAAGAGSMKPVIQFVGIIVAGAVLVYGAYYIAKANEQIRQLTSQVKPV